MENTLAAWMDFFDKQHMGAPRFSGGMSLGMGGDEFNHAQNQAADSAGRYLWARNMMDQEQQSHDRQPSPDFFSFGRQAPQAPQTQYAQPQQPFTLKPMTQVPMANDPGALGRGNYLAQLLKGR